MDYKEPVEKRKKKKDKAKEKFDRNGKFSAAHVRKVEAVTTAGKKGGKN